MSFEEAEAGLGTPAVGIHRDGRAVILDDRYDDAPVLEDGRLLARLSRTTRADAAGEEETCYLGAAVVDLFVSLTGNSTAGIGIPVLRSASRGCPSIGQRPGNGEVGHDRAGARSRRARKTSLGWNAMAAGPWPVSGSGSPNAFSPWPRRSGRSGGTGKSVHLTSEGASLGRQPGRAGW